MGTLSLLAFFTRKLTAIGLYSTQLDVVLLSVMSNRFMSIAEQMGRTLQRTAISTNIKERLDFSCALFGVRDVPPSLA